MEMPIDRQQLLAMGEGIPRYERVAQAVENAILSSQLRPGERLPTVRQFAQHLAVSGTTIAAAYNLLSDKNYIRSEVGRGTFVIGARGDSSESVRISRAPMSHVRLQQRDKLAKRSAKVPWRRRSLVASASRLRAAYPAAVDCSTGRPDPGLLPLEVLKRAWKKAIDQIDPEDLQYAGPEPIETLTQELLPRLAADNVPARESDLVVGSSAQQLMVLTLQVLASRAGHADTVVAVEEPGYPTIFDAYERLGYRLVGIEVDEKGAIPTSLDSILSTGVTAVLFTPRAHNPTGASWSADRRMAIADVLAAHPEVVAIEDDQFAGIASTRAGSLLLDRRIEDRVVYIRSFSKSVAPDLRLGIAAARPRMKTFLTEAKGFADGWSSRLSQRALALALADEQLDSVLAAACNSYAERRGEAIRGLDELIHAGGSAWSGADGVNVWVHLPSGVDSNHVIGKAAEFGVLVAPGEPFFVLPGHGDVVRLNAGSVGATEALKAGKALATASLTEAERTSAIIHV